LYLLIFVSWRSRYQVNDITDELLLAAAKAGDREAFLLLFQRHRTPIFRFLYRLLGSEEAAEDISHDCFLDLVRCSEDSKFTEGSSLTQLYKRARILAMQYLRNLEEKTHRHTQTGDPQVRVGDQPQLAKADGELVASVKQAIDGLPPLEREGLILFEYQRLDVNEIATIVEASDEQVRARLNGARQRLRAALSRYVD
jgi:RNA polymerase sigma-70 factor (ECF subfamily)